MAGLNKRYSWKKWYFKDIWNSVWIRFVSSIILEVIKGVRGLEF